jgi:hypothetical protein
MSPFWKRGSKPVAQLKNVNLVSDEDEAPQEQKQVRVRRA